MKKGCEKLFLKEEGAMIEGKWYCSEKCAPSKEELLIEEQRLLKKFEKESMNLNSSRLGQSNQSKGGEELEEEEEDLDEEEEGQDEDDGDGVGFELSVDISNKKEVLTLAELEEKYKNLSQVASKAQKGGDELEDSLN